VIRLNKVFKAFPKGSLALKDVSFHLAKGEFLFLTGHSGAGKSTILRLVYADDLPTSGMVRVSGFSTSSLKRRDIPRLRRRLGIVFQDFRLLEDKAQAYPRELSGGEQQRVAIARALVNDPLVLLADEPTGNLDERATRGVFQLLRDINATGTAVVLATHDLDLVRAAPYRTIELQDGAVVYDSVDDEATEAEEAAGS
jgi:cell division transport system ATP-binding protein